ncbi:NifB/NifX family molybdenum-iron cluster-binding protein [Cellulosilyticum ruminicola]|uniref:NifB/NifX family molybdenum-iron cluster-binding protein n=1 Tax=Cellulosilyticum ruminicola TaxID=425254 RepID=UPI0006D2A230|nr:NifB/NifX family molybdenum-iron cluster-binding protein [Cellulosilyticum ruminicola]
MDNDQYFIAVASSDGLVVNSHFGRAHCFYIYKVSNDDTVQLIERRAVVPICDGGNHNNDKLYENLLKLKDCSYLLVSRIGNQAAYMAENMGIIPMEIPGVIEEAIIELIKYKK